MVNGAGHDGLDESMEERLSWAIDHADLDELTGIVDSLCFDERFNDVVALRHRCRAALERGLQLWPIAAYADYRLALDSPGPAALTGLGQTSERFMFGPFAEVLASTHPFASLSQWLPRSPDASAFAHECVVRGEDLRADDVAVALPDVLGLPLALQPWEPRYAVAEYRPDRARFDSPDLAVPATAVELVNAGRINDSRVTGSLADLVTPWTASSNGRVEVAAVEGRAEDAIGALGLRRASIIEVSAADSIALMAWAAANGGAHGRRRGGAAGRHLAWWALRALTGLDDDADVDPDELGVAASELRWLHWNDGSPATGWALRLAVEDPEDGLAWVVSAVDAS